MKIRTGFVSNSSSTSFYINADLYSEDIVRAAIEEMNTSSGYTVYFSTREEVCTRIAEFMSWVEDEPVDVTYTRLLEYIPENVLVIDSEDDNSIDWKVQDMLVDDYMAYRQHWG